MLHPSNRSSAFLEDGLFFESFFYRHDEALLRFLVICRSLNVGRTGYTKSVRSPSTTRELEVLRLIRDGYRNKQIADREPMIVASPSRKTG
jgi:hypothetical protein